MTNPELLTVMLSIESLIKHCGDKAEAADAVLELVQKIIAQTCKPAK